jgi:hypothetical protein
MGEKNYLSPISFGRPDPIEEFATKLKTSGNKEDYKLGRKIEAKMRTYAPVIVRGEEQEGVKFWGFGKMVYQELLSVMADPDYGDITDPVNGRDIVVEFKTSEETGRAFPMTNIRVKPNQTPLTENTEVMKVVKDTQKNITDIYSEMEYDDLQKALEAWLHTENDVEDKDIADPAKATNSQAATEDVSSAFDDLFNS